MASASSRQDLIKKIKALPEDKIPEVADFVELVALEAEEQRATAAVAKLSEDAFSKVWDKPDDAEYDKFDFVDVVLVPFPFTDQTTTTKRIAVILGQP